jgi:urease accessory protein
VSDEPGAEGPADADAGDAAALESLRLSDSALPVGTDSVSYGLEQFVAADRVTDADDLAALLDTYLRRQLGPADLVALRAAHAAARGGGLSGIRTADRRLEAVTLQAEFRESAARTGGRLLSLQRELRDDTLLDDYAAAVDDGEVPGAYPVVLGAVAARVDVGERRACLVACQEFATAFVGAAQRLLALGHTDAQRVLVDCQPAMADAVETSAGRSVEEMTPFSPLVDVASADHERADRRLFLS